MTHLQGFTVVSYSQIGYGTALASSFCRHNPGSSFVVVVLDRPTFSIVDTSPNIRYITAHDLDRLIPDFYARATSLGDVHLAAHIAPMIAAKLAETCDFLFYFHPKTLVYSSLEATQTRLVEHEVLLVPRRLKPSPDDGLSPKSHFFHHGGIFNSGMLGINCETGDFIDWWCSESQLTLNLEFPTDFRFADQASTLFKSHILRDPSCGVAYWNMDERELSFDDDCWKVGDSPLTIASFAGFNVEEPFWATEHVTDAPRLRLSNDGIARKLYAEYANEVAKQQKILGKGDQSGYGWASVIPDVLLTSGLRYVFRSEWLKANTCGSPLPPVPLRVGELQPFIRWLEAESSDPGPRLQRFILATIVDRPDIRDEFVHGRSVDYAGLGRWIVAHGRAEQPITMLCRFNPPTRDTISDQGRSTHGVDVIGSLTSEHGLGEAGRLMVEALRCTPEKVSTISFSPVGIRGKHPFTADNVSRNKLTLVALNPEQMRDLWSEYGESLRANRYVIGQWFWELEVPPPWYRTAFRDRVVNELWAPTRFIEEMLTSCAPQSVEVKYMPLPLLEPTCSSNFTLDTIGLESRFTFLFTFDFGSVMKRKNPDGAILAFKKAFAPGEGPQLIIKSINGHLRPKEFEHIRWLCDGRDDIVLVDRYLDNDDNAALIGAADCYVSLHRSEGLGLTIAEAMLLEKPVIATGYSGNLDFMDETTGLMVPWKYTKVGRGADAYPSTARWAEPDLDIAAEMMRWVFANQGEATRVGVAARERILKEFSPQVCGERMHKRLMELR